MSGKTSNGVRPAMTPSAFPGISVMKIMMRSAAAVMAMDAVVVQNSAMIKLMIRNNSGIKIMVMTYINLKTKGDLK
jgi:hypothetical protein